MTTFCERRTDSISVADDGFLERYPITPAKDCGSLPHNCWNKTGVNLPLQSMRLTDDDDDIVGGLGGQIGNVFSDEQLLEEESLKSNRLIEPPGDAGGRSADAPDDDDDDDDSSGGGEGWLSDVVD